MPGRVPNTEQMDRLLGRESSTWSYGCPAKTGLTPVNACATNNQIPIIMLTAKGDELSRIKGLELGPMTTWPSLSTPMS